MLSALRSLGRPSIDAQLESLFARGIDPPSPLRGYGETSPRAAEGWPEREAVRAFVDEADARVVSALKHDEVDPEPVFTILEHEAMHQETLLYMWHRLPFDQKKRPAGYAPMTDGRVPADEWIDIPAGRRRQSLGSGAQSRNS